MAKKAATKRKRAYRGMMIASHLETAVHRYIKSEAKANGTTIQWQINTRLKRPMEADLAAKRDAMTAAN